MDVELIAKYQTGIVGLIGFAGVIVTLFVNAWIARRQVRDHRDHERRVLVRALRAELPSLRRSTEMNIKHLRNMEPGTPGVLVPAVHETVVFDANVARLGSLPDGQVGPVLDAYIYMKEFDRNLALISHPDKTGFYRVLDLGHVEHVTTMLESLMPKLDAGIENLEHRE